MAEKSDAQPQPENPEPPAPTHNAPAVVAAPQEAVPPAAEQTVVTAPPLELPEGAAPVGEPPAAPAAPESPVVDEPVVPAVPDYKSQLCDSLGLAADSTDEQISQALTTQKQTAEDARQKEVDDLMAGHEMPDEAKAALRETLLADRSKGEALLNAMPKKAPVAPIAPVPQPPAPTHTPPGQQGAKNEVSAEQKVTDQNALIKEIQGKGKFSDYSSAREEARRQKPELFS